MRLFAAIIVLAVFNAVAVAADMPWGFKNPIQFPEAVPEAVPEKETFIIEEIFTAPRSQGVETPPPLLEMKCTTEIVDHNTMTFGCTNDVKGWWTFSDVKPNGEYVIILDRIWGKDMEILMQAAEYVISITLTTYDGRKTFKLVPVFNIIGKRV